ncbi:MAG: flippase-like domain-containing protein [Bacteroidetes bacterium]|nr:flippase-like domain-containing protein [Bacteroidota bacterium]
MKKRSFILRVAASLAVTAFFLWLAFRERDMSGLLQTLAQKPLLWLAGLFLLQAFSHLLRAVRWRYLMQPVSKDVPVHSAFAALMIGFMINGLVPRAGEVARSFVLGRKVKAPTAAVLSTVILERMLDFVSFASVLCVVAVLNIRPLEEWFHIPHEARWVLYLLVVGLLLLFVTLFLRSSIIFAFLKRLVPLFPARHRQRIEDLLANFLKGFEASTMGKNYGAIALLTFSIWFTYIVLLYLPFRIFDMQHLTMTEAATLQISNGIAAAVPTPNGIGSYHSFISYTLTSIFGVNERSAVAYVVYTHAIGYLCTLSLGILYLFRENIRITEVMDQQ